MIDEPAQVPGALYSCRRATSVNALDQIVAALTLLRYRVDARGASPHIHRARRIVYSARRRDGARRS
jgi:hypothetical protein